MRADHEPRALVEAFVADHHRRVVRAVALFCGDPALAEDAVQDALGRAWERLERGDEIHALERWVVTVAFNQVRTRVRRTAREVLVDRIAERGADDARQDLDLARALRRLPHRQRASVVLHHYLDLSVDDAAAVMGVSPGTVKTSLSRARSSLARELGDG